MTYLYEMIKQILLGGGTSISVKMTIVNPEKQNCRHKYMKINDGILLTCVDTPSKRVAPI